jgi:hypothetical protein
MRLEKGISSYPVESEGNVNVEGNRELEKKARTYSEMIASGSDKDVEELVREMEKNSGKVLISCDKEKDGRRRLLFGDKHDIDHTKGWNINNWNKEVINGAAS